jgi:hypothetical protein
MSGPSILIEAMPLFSVIIPLEYHRGQWERCWRGWQAQTLPKDQYELILVVPPDFPDRKKLPALLGPGDRLEYSTERHDIGLALWGPRAPTASFCSLPNRIAGRRRMSWKNVCKRSQRIPNGPRFHAKRYVSRTVGSRPPKPTCMRPTSSTA